jgi:hypothetical protein
VPPEEKGARDLETAFGDAVSSVGAHGAQSLEGIAAMNDRQTAELALTKVLKLERRQKLWMWLTLGMLAAIGLMAWVAARSQPREPEIAPDDPIGRFDEARRKFAVALWKCSSDCKSAAEVLEVCDEGASAMKEPPERYYEVVSTIAGRVHERGPQAKIAVRRLVELLRELTQLYLDYDRSTDLITGFLAKPESEQPPTKYRIYAVCAVTRSAETKYEPDAELVDRLARQFESENLRFFPGMDGSKLYDTQARQDDLAVLALRPLGVPARSRTLLDSQQP